jgi:hypothetical protein
MKKTILFFLAAAITCLSCEETHNHSLTTTSTVESSNNGVVKATEKSVSEGESQLKEKGENDFTRQIKEARIEKNRRDSVFAANRQEVWVYQIGVSKSKPTDFEKTYNILSTRMQNLYFFKKSPNNYYLILHDGYNSEKELLGKQNKIEATLAQAGIKDKVQVVNITTYCGLKEEIKPAAEVKLAKKETAICYTCD